MGPARPETRWGRFFPPGYAHLLKSPTAPTKHELTFMKRRAADFSRGQTRSGQYMHDFHGWAKGMRTRCSVGTSNHRSLNQRDLPQSVRSRCGEFHRTLYTYCYANEMPQGIRTVLYPYPVTKTGAVRVGRPQNSEYIHTLPQKEITQSTRDGRPGHMFRTCGRRGRGRRPERRWIQG